MIGLGALINTAAIMAGGVLGRFGGRLIKERHQSTLQNACGVSTMFLGIAGAMEGMLTAKDGMISSGRGLFVVLCLTLGALIGEIINLEDGFERFGEWLKIKTGNAGDQGFVNAFVTASLTVCIGAMAIVGSIQDGLHGDYSTLAVKSILDLIIILVMTYHPPIVVATRMASLLQLIAPSAKGHAAHADALISSKYREVYVQAHPLGQPFTQKALRHLAHIGSHRAEVCIRPVIAQRVGYRRNILHAALHNDPHRS